MRGHTFAGASGIVAVLALFAPRAQAQDTPASDADPAVPATAPLPPATASDSKDSGLGLEWVYLNADVGGAYVDMQSFSESNFGLVTTHAAGPVFGAAVGARLLFFSVGARVRDAQLSSIGDLWQVDGEAAFHLRVWRIDPYFGLRGGYVWLGSLDAQSVSVATGGSASAVAVHGFDLGPMVGIDFYFAHYVSIGFEGEAEFLFLQRPPPALPPGVTTAVLTPQQQTLYQNSGSSVGLGAVATAHLGIHF